MNLFSLIREDFRNVKENDPALKSRLELFFNYPGLWALLFYRIAHSLHKKNIPYLPRLISGLGQFLTIIDIHPAATIGRRVFIDHGVGIVIGETAEVEDDVLIYQQVTLGGVSLEKGKRHPTIKSGAILGAGAKILGNIIVGENAKIGANSVVVKNVPDNCTAIGVPARIIARGFDQNKFSHNKIPDINKEIFEYMFKRLAIIEAAIKTKDASHLKDDDAQLDEIYELFINSLKD
ncbi:MAG: serine O-acetyltransferase [Campylobacterales bacterium]|nr:serine O-acetyltransferase [Campylobacterales bacterium]